MERKTAEPTLNHDLLAPSQSLPSQSFQPQRQQLQFDGRWGIKALGNECARKLPEEFGKCIRMLTGPQHLPTLS